MSIIGLWARRCGKWLVGIVAVMALAQIVFFLQKMKPSTGLEETFNGSHFALFGFLAAIAFMLVFALKGRDGRARTNYTLRRLGMTPQKFFFLRAVHNILCFLILWGVELLIACGLCLVYRATFPAQWENQSMLLAFYRQPFLHGLLPLGDWYLYIRNILWIAIYGASTALFSNSPSLILPLITSLLLIAPAEMGAGVPEVAITGGAAVLLLLIWMSTTKKGEEAVFDGREVEENE